MIKIEKVSEGIYEVKVNGEYVGNLEKFLGNYQIKMPSGKLVKATNLNTAKKMIALAIK